VLYGEWLWLTHGTAYDALPDWLVALDLWHAAAGFLDVDDRDLRVAAGGLAVPPRRFTGVLGTRSRLRGLFGRSAYSRSERAEGLVLRAADGQRCKVVDPAYRRRGDDEWADGQRNAVATSR
jgi:hypothetical protein